MTKLLVVVDMQNDFTFGVLRSDEAIAIIPSVVDKVKKYDGEVVYTLDTHYPGYLETQEGRKLPVEHCFLGTEGHNLVEPLKELQEEMSSKTYIKETFGSMKLAEEIRKRHESQPFEEIELVGVCTDICVISNAMLIKSAVPEVTVKVDASCCAGVSIASHNNALDAMKVCQIEVYNEQ